jgi:hypothetical protein
MGGKSLTPALIDFSKDSEESMREKIKAACSGSLSPCFVVANHGLEPLIDRVINMALNPTGGDSNCHSTDGASSTKSPPLAPPLAPPPAPCTTCEIADTSAGQALREALREKVVGRLVDTLTGGPEYRRGLADAGKVLDGRVSVRCYDRKAAVVAGGGTSLESSIDDPDVLNTADSSALGPHCDGNVLTVLFANGPGLQIPGPESDLTPAKISAVGMPSIGPVETDNERKSNVSWVDVGGFWKTRGDASSSVCDLNGGSAAGGSSGPAGGLLVTFGHGWMQDTNAAPLRAALPEIRCPVLHRVRHLKASDELPACGIRMSIPYLVRFLDAPSVAVPSRPACSARVDLGV